MEHVLGQDVTAEAEQVQIVTNKSEMARIKSPWSGWKDQYYFWPLSPSARQLSPADISTGKIYMSNCWSAKTAIAMRLVTAVKAKRPMWLRFCSTTGYWLK